MVCRSSTCLLRSSGQERERGSRDSSIVLISKIAVTWGTRERSAHLPIWASRAGRSRRAADVTRDVTNGMCAPILGNPRCVFIKLAQTLAISSKIRKFVLLCSSLVCLHVDIIRPGYLPLNKQPASHQLTRTRKDCSPPGAPDTSPGAPSTSRQVNTTESSMALAMVSTPDVAKDLFSGLWEQNTDLYQAYQNLGTQSFPSSQSMGAAYNVVTTSYIPMTCSPPTTSGYLPPSTSYIPKSTPSTKSSYIACPTPPYVAQQATAPSPRLVAQQATARSPRQVAQQATTLSPRQMAQQAGSPRQVAQQAGSPGQQSSPNSRYSSPASCGSSTASSDVGKADTVMPDAASTSDYTKLALILISQSQKKVGSWNILYYIT